MSMEHNISTCFLKPWAQSQVSLLFPKGHLQLLLTHFPAFARALRSCDRACKCDAHDKSVSFHSVSEKLNAINNTNGEIVFKSASLSSLKIKIRGLF